MNKADTKTAKAKDLVERSTYLAAGSWQIDNEGDEVYDKRPYPVKTSIV